MFMWYKVIFLEFYIGVCNEWISRYKTFFASPPNTRTHFLSTSRQCNTALTSQNRNQFIILVAIKFVERQRLYPK